MPSSCFVSNVLLFSFLPEHEFHSVCMRISFQNLKFLDALAICVDCTWLEAGPYSEEGCGRSNHQRWGMRGAALVAFIFLEHFLFLFCYFWNRWSNRYWNRSNCCRTCDWWNCCCCSSEEMNPLINWLWLFRATALSFTCIFCWCYNDVFSPFHWSELWAWFSFRS